MILRDIRDALNAAVSNLTGQTTNWTAIVTTTTTDQASVGAACRDDATGAQGAQDTSVNDDENGNTNSEDTYLFEGEEYTLEQLQQLCELLTTTLIELQSQLNSFEARQNFVFYQRINTDINNTRPRKEAVCNLVEDIISGRYQDRIDGNQETQLTDLTEEEALRDLDAASRDLQFGSSLGLNTDNYLALARRSLITNLVNYGGQTSDLNRYFSLDKPIVKDKIKYFFNSFYSLEDNNELIIYDTKSDLNYLSIINVQQSNYTNADINNFDFPVLTENISFRLENGLTPVNGRAFPDFKRSFLNGGAFVAQIIGQQTESFNFEPLIGDGSIIDDDTFQIDLPFENSEIFEDINVYGAFIADIKSKYNFYSKDYERIAINSNVSSNERNFPNLYVVMSERERNNGLRINSNVTQNGNLSSFEAGGDAGYLNVDISEGITLDSIIQNRDIIFLVSAVRKMNEMNKNKFLFPMFNEISIPTNKSNNILKMFYNSNLMDSFVLNLSNLINSNSFEESDFVFSEKILNQNLNRTESNNVQPPVSSSYSSKKTRIKQLSLINNLPNSNTNFLTYFINNPISDNINQLTIIGDTQDLPSLNNNSMRFINSLRRIIFQGQLTTFLKNNCRNYIDILNGKTSYNETLVYRIAKYEVGATEPIQNFWIPNDDTLDFLNLVDTQIKYEKEYVYKIYAYQIVIGTSYFHQSLDLNPNSLTNFNCTTFWQANPKIIEVELLSVNRRIVDSPPLSPEIDFIPYFNVDNKIGLFLNTRVGREKLETINILDSDTDKTSLYAKDRNNLVSYETDDLSKRYEVMRLDVKPMSYSDFKKGIIKISEYDFDPDDPNEEISSASIIDDIVPNKKYYYCFRSIDIHDNISNPTAVYEVEMINENGMIFPIIKKFEFEKPIFETSKEMRRFIKIKPQLQHYLLDTQRPEILNSTSAQQALNQNFILGMDSVCSPWGQTFKIVATSKQTGRKIEIKFKFKYNIE